MPVTDAEVAELAGRMGALENRATKLAAMVDLVSVLLGPQVILYGAAVVNEDDANGTVAATLADVEGGKEPLTFSLTDSAGGRFAVNSSTGQITIADAASIVYATAKSHTVEITVTDAKGKSTARTLTVAVEQGAGAPAFGISLDANVVDEAWVNSDPVGTAAASVEATAPVVYSLFDDAGGRFAIDPGTGVITVANASLIDPGQAASHSITVQGVDNAGAGNTVQQAFSIQVAGKVQIDVANSGLVQQSATSVSQLGGNITISAGVNRKAIVELILEDFNATASLRPVTATITIDGNAVTIPAVDIIVLTGDDGSYVKLWGRYDIPDAVVPGAYALLAVFKDAQGDTATSSQGGQLFCTLFRNARQGPLFQPVTSKFSYDGAAISTAVSFPSFVTELNGTAVLSSVAVNNHARTFTHYAEADGELWDQSAGSPGVASSATYEIRDAAG